MLFTTSYIFIFAITQESSKNYLPFDFSVKSNTSGDWKTGILFYLNQTKLNEKMRVSLITEEPRKTLSKKMSFFHMYIPIMVFQPRNTIFSFWKPVYVKQKR